MAILQHPKGEPLKFAIGAVEHVAEDGRRFQYTTNTDQGSSGSPVFDKYWNLVGLHHSAVPLTGTAKFGNEGLPLNPILTEIQPFLDEARKESEQLELNQSVAEEKEIELEYLRQIVKIYEDWLTEYTELSSALTLDEREKRRHAALYDLMCQRHPPEYTSNRFAVPSREAKEQEEAIVRAPTLEQVANMPQGAILGAPGAGKSTTLRRMALRYTQIAMGQQQPGENDQHGGKIPLLVPLGGYAGEDLLEFVTTFLFRPRFSDDYAHSEKLAQRLKS